MPEYLSPGVYIEEVNTGPRPIEGVGTAMAAFVGFAPAGEVNKPVLITNWSQYVEKFGASDEGGRKNPHMPGAYLSHSVYGYFQNGGGRCYVTRIGDASSNGHAAPSIQIPSRNPNGAPSFSVQSRNKLTGDIKVKITPSGEGAPEGSFNIQVEAGGEREEYPSLNMSGRGGGTLVETLKRSRLITILEPQTSGAIADRLPLAGDYVITPATPAALPKVKSESFKGELAERSGIEGLAIAEDATMICCPDLMASYEAKVIDEETVKAVQTAMIAHCEQMGDRMAILDPLPGLGPQQMREWRATTNYDSKFAAFYYPWVKVTGPDGKPMAVPPSGHMAGIYARNDNERGVHKAPANEVVRGALEPATQITKGEQDLLNPIGVNCIRSFPSRGIRVWGARTISSDPAWRYVNVRRLFNYVEKSIEQGTQWVVFEPNDPDLWARVRRDVGAFLTGVWRSGALFGLTADEAFFVKCDAETNPPEVRDRGQLTIEIGLAPVKPAEFVVFRLSQFSGGGA